MESYVQSINGSRQHFGCYYTPVKLMNSNPSSLTKNTPIIHEQVETSLKHYFTFIQKCKVNNDEYLFSQNSESSPFTLCFAIFGLNFLKKNDQLITYKDILHQTLRNNLEKYKAFRINFTDELRFDKPFMQLLTFTLSCFEILQIIDSDPLASTVEPLISKNIKRDLEFTKSLQGAPQSGNQAMFMAILIIHAQKHLGHHIDNMLEEWVDLHLLHMNKFGFWGNNKQMTHLQFQNGYHQYEIFKYLDLDLPNINKTASHVAMLADSKGHFAPYPGGGGCYDYDAVFLLTYHKIKTEDLDIQLLKKTFFNILSEQNPDGGFAENKFLGTLSMCKSLKIIFDAIGSKTLSLKRERLRRAIGLLRSKNRRVPTHWTKYSRLWNESNLWDSWFRMMAIALIQERLFPEISTEINFINFPGIGYHHEVNQK